MAGRKSSRVNRKYKTKYRVTNWREYERGLRCRGDITVWFSKEVCDAWTPPNNGRRGAQPRYSNLAIVTALTLRMVFRLPLRQTEGFLDSLLRLMDLDVRAPDHTTLSRRNKDVDVPSPSGVLDGPIHLIVDSTGLKISGAGEWHAHRHKSSKARRVWRKLHVGVDDDGFIVAATLTKSSEDDPSTVPKLLEQVDSPIKRFTADGAYDTRPVYEGRWLRAAPRARGRSGTRPSRQFTKSGAKAGSGTQGIVDRAPSRIFSLGTSARSETAFARAATNRRSGRR